MAAAALLEQALQWGEEHGLSAADMIYQAAHLSESVQNLRASSYLSAAGLMILIYDTVLTFPDEVRLIWPMPWGIIKCIWVFSRYIVMGMVVLYNYQLFPARAVMSDSVCRAYVVVSAWLINISFAAGNWLLLLRVSALWGRKKVIIYPLYACYVALYITTSVILGFSSVNMWHHLAYNPFANICIFNERIPKTLIHSQWLPIVFDLVMFGLTLVKAKQDNIALRKRSRANAPVLFILFRDGGIYCIVIIALRLANFIAWAFLVDSLVYLWLGFLFAIVSMLINRFYLNLRAVAFATAAALLTNASIRERPAGAGAQLRQLVEGDMYARRGAPSPWGDYEDDKSPVIEVGRNGAWDIDEVMMIEVERKRAQTLDRTIYSPTPHPGGDLEEALPPIPNGIPHNGILISQGVVIH